MTCNGICGRYKAVKPIGVGRYASGQKRCQICSIYVNMNSDNCLCCGYRLRTKPRNMKYKTKYNELQSAGLVQKYGIKMKE